MAAPTTSLGNVTVRKLNSVIASLWNKIKNTFAPKDDGQQTHDTTKFYRADGSWAVPASNIPVFIDGTITRSGIDTYSVTCSTTYAQVSQYLSEGKVPVCKFSRSDTGQTWYFYYHMTYANNRHAFGSTDIYNVSNNDTAYASCVYVETDDSWTFIEVETYDNDYWSARLATKASATPTFSEASTRDNLNGSNESMTTILGKIKKWFTDLKALAFKDTVSYNDLSSVVRSSLDKADTALQSSGSYPNMNVGNVMNMDIGSSAVNLNDYTQSNGGIQVLNISTANADNVTNRPVSGGGEVEIVSAGGGYVHQVFYPTDNSGDVFRRYRFDTIWSAWAKQAKTYCGWPNNTTGLHELGVFSSTGSNDKDITARFKISYTPVIFSQAVDIDLSINARCTISGTSITSTNGGPVVAYMKGTRTDVNCFTKLIDGKLHVYVGLLTDSISLTCRCIWSVDSFQMSFSAVNSGVSTRPADLVPAALYAVQVQSF